MIWEDWLTINFAEYFVCINIPYTSEFSRQIYIFLLIFKILYYTINLSIKKILKTYVFFEHLICFAFRFEQLYIEAILKMNKI